VPATTAPSAEPTPGSGAGPQQPRAARLPTEIFARFEQAAALADETGAPPAPSSRSSPPPGWSASSGSTSKAATATQNHPGNAPNAPPASSNTASATTLPRPPHHLPRTAEMPDLRSSRPHRDPPVGRAGGSARVLGGPPMSPSVISSAGPPVQFGTRSWIDAAIKLMHRTGPHELV